MNIKGKQSVESFHKRLGKIMGDKCGMARNEKGLKEAIAEIRALREQLWKDARIQGTTNELNPDLEKAGRIADFLELGELMCIDALERNESCGGHFREEYQTPDGGGKGDERHSSYWGAWGSRGPRKPPELSKGPLEFESVHPSQRSYK